MARRKVIVKDTGYYLRLWRAKRDLSQAQAAKKFSLSPSHWSLMEHGQRKPSSELAHTLALATGAPILLLLGIEPPEREKADR